LRTRHREVLFNLNMGAFFDLTMGAFFKLNRGAFLKLISPQMQLHKLALFP
jgi:hypothetical protein